LELYNGLINTSSRCIITWYSIMLGQWFDQYFSNIITTESTTINQQGNSLGDAYKNYQDSDPKDSPSETTSTQGFNLLNCFNVFFVFRSVFFNVLGHFFRFGPGPSFYNFTVVVASARSYYYNKV
jgi:hypothetical protein